MSKPANISPVESFSSVTVYYSPLCLRGQFIRLVTERYTVINQLPLPKFHLYPLGVKAPSELKSHYLQLPVAILQEYIMIEDYRMIWYELFGRFMAPHSHCLLRDVLDFRMNQTYHTSVLPLLNSKAGKKAILRLASRCYRVESNVNKQDKLMLDSLKEKLGHGFKNLFYKNYIAPRLFSKLARELAFTTKCENQDCIDHSCDHGAYDEVRTTCDLIDAALVAIKETIDYCSSQT